MSAETMEQYNARKREYLRKRRIQFLEESRILYTCMDAVHVNAYLEEITRIAEDEWEYNNPAPMAQPCINIWI